MLVCHCNGVSERQIRKAVRNGADSLHSVGRACGAGTCCGGCSSEILEIIERESPAREPLTLHEPAASPAG